MRFPWANTALLILLLAQLVSGYLGFVNGRDERGWILWLHGAGAYALLLLLYWKNQIILDVLGRGGRLSRQRIGFLAMLLLFLLTLTAGLLWTFAGPIYLFGFSLLTLHIFLAVVFMLLLVWHTWRRRWILRVDSATNRRAFVQTSAAALAGFLLWRGADWAKEALDLAGANRRFTGSYETGSFSGVFPRVSWINDDPEPVEVASWALRLGGAVERPLNFGYEQLRQMEQVDLEAVLDCTGGWYSAQIWRGVPVATLLSQAGVGEEARSITFRSITGYRRRFTVEQANRYLLALEVAAQPLSHGHGFPLRLVAPAQRGVNWVKWIDQIWVNRTPAWLQLPLPLQ